MDNVVPLNPKLSTVLEELLAWRPGDRSIVVPFCRALRACQNDAETARVLSSQISSVLEGVRADQSPVWAALDQILDVVALVPVPRKPDAPPKKSLESDELAHEVTPHSDVDSAPKRNQTFDSDGFVDALLEHSTWEREAREEHQKRGFRHVPFGMDGYFEELRRSGFKHDFQRDLDHNLSRLLPLYAALEPNRAPVESDNTIGLLRVLLDGLLEIWGDQFLEKTDLDEILENTCLLDDVEPDDECAYDGARARAGNFLTHVRQVNLAAFDVLYLSSEDVVSSLCENYFNVDLHRRQVVALGASMPSADGPVERGGSEAEESPEAPDDWTISSDAGFSVTKLLRSLITLTDSNDALLGRDSRAFLSAIPLSFEPDLLLPQLRAGLVGHWTCDAHSILESAPLSKAFPISGGSIEDLASGLATLAMHSYLQGTESIEPDKSRIALLGAFGIESRKPRLDELFRDVMRVEKVIEFEVYIADGSNLSNAIRYGGEYGILLEELYAAIRSAPRTGERMTFEMMPMMSDNRTFPILYAEFLHAYIDEPFPAVFSIVSAFAYDMFIESLGERGRVDEYHKAWKTCIDEGLYITASYLFCYHLVTAQMPAVTGFGADAENTRITHARLTQADVYEYCRTVRNTIEKLEPKVPRSPIMEALKAAIQVHRITNALEDDDYYSEHLRSIHAKLLEGLPQSEDAQRHTAPKGILYEARLQSLTDSRSSSWPVQLRDHVRRIELQHDFSVGSDIVVDLEKNGDYAWAVSYFKIMESMLRRKLCFLFEEDHRHWVELANPSRKVGLRYEQALVIRVLERAKKQNNKYQGLVAEFERRGIQFPGLVGFFREHMEQAKVRNKQAHSSGTLREAEQLRRWVLDNLDHAMSLLAVDQADFDHILHT